MMLASLMFTAMIAAVKVARQELAVFEVIGWRAAFSIPLLFVFGRRHGLVVRRRRVLVLRSALGLGAMACFYEAAAHLALTDLTLIGKLQPLFVALLAPLALGAQERPRALVLVVVGLGLTGSTFIIGPELQVGSLVGLWALAAAVLSAAAHVAIRALGQSESPYALVLWFQVFTLIAALVVQTASGAGFSMPPSHLWPYLAGCGLAATVGQVAMTHAYARDRASTVAAASYVAPIFGVAGDLLVFGALPAARVWIGGALVVGAGLLLLRSQERKAAPMETERGLVTPTGTRNRVQ
jgi:drug/metabolite transporter (DMT)-like permease